MRYKLYPVNSKLKIIKNITDLIHKFDGYNYLTSIEISPFDMSNVVKIEYLFNNCCNLKQLPKILSDWNISKVNNTQFMYCRY